MDSGVVEYFERYHGGHLYMHGDGLTLFRIPFYSFVCASRSSIMFKCLVIYLVARIIFLEMSMGMCRKRSLHKLLSCPLMQLDSLNLKPQEASHQRQAQALNDHREQRGAQWGYDLIDCALDLNTTVFLTTSNGEALSCQDVERIRPSTDGSWWIMIPGRARAVGAGKAVQWRSSSVAVLVSLSSSRM